MNARQNRKRLRKLIRGGFQVGKYASYSTVMLSLGCITIDNWISVSEDGRYVALQVYQDKKEVAVCREMSTDSNDITDFYIIDLKTKKANFIGSSDNAWGWLSNTKNQIAFMGSVDDNTSVSVISKEHKLSLPNVAYPCLSGNGKWVAYSQMEEKEPLRTMLFLKKLPDGEPQIIANNGILADFSPDSKHLSFLVVEEDDDEEKCHLVISSIDGKNQKLIDTLTSKIYGHGNEVLFPHWINNKQVIYKNINEKSGEDGEIFLADRSGKITQITNNEEPEIFFQASKKGIFYGIPTEKSDGHPLYDLHYSFKAKDKWIQQKLGLSPFYYKIAKDKVVYVALEENEEDSKYQTYLYMVSLDDLIKGKELSPVDLTDIIRNDK